MNAFKSESDLCAAFIEALPDGWTSYPETAGFDILLVADDGFQIGIEAKMRTNAKVISQAVESLSDCCLPGPDCRAILVPAGKVGSFRGICRLLAITVIECGRREDIWLRNVKPGPWAFMPRLPSETGRNSYSAERDWHQWCPVKRCPVPDYVPDVVAGVPAPLRLTAWKIKAIKILILLERRGFVTRHDFKALGFDPRRWIVPAYGWLTTQRRGVYVAGPNLPDLRRAHPTNYPEIEADFEKWAPLDMLTETPEERRAP